MCQNPTTAGENLDADLDPLAAAKAAARAGRIRLWEEEERRLGKIVREKAKAARDADFFHRWPKSTIPTPEELKERDQQRIARDVELVDAMSSGVSIEALRVHKAYWAKKEHRRLEKNRKARERRAAKKAGA